MQTQSKNVIKLSLNDDLKKIKKNSNNFYDGNLGDRSIKKKFAEITCDDFTRHSLIEEKIFYPKFTRPAKASDTAKDVTVYECLSSEKLVTQVKAIEAFQALRGAKVRMLFSQVDHCEESLMHMASQRVLKVINVELLTLGVDICERQHEDVENIN